MTICKRYAASEMVLKKEGYINDEQLSITYKPFMTQKLNTTIKIIPQKMDTPINKYTSKFPENRYHIKHQMLCLYKEHDTFSYESNI